MPFRGRRKRFRKFKRKFGFRRFRRFSRRFGRKGRPTRAIFKQIIPDVVFTKLKLTFYDEVIIPQNSSQFVTAAKGNSFWQAALANNISVTGVQAYANFFQRSTILGSKVKLTYIPGQNTNIGIPESSNRVVGMLVLIPATQTDLNGLPLVAMDDILEQKYSKGRSFGNANSSHGTIIKHFMSTKKLYGQSVTQEEDFTQLINNLNSMATIADPDNLWYWQVVFGTNLPAATVGGLFIGRLWWQITYYVKLENRKHIATGPDTGAGDDIDPLNTVDQ